MNKPHYFIFIFVQLNKMGEARVYQTSTMWQHGPLNRAWACKYCGILRPDILCVYKRGKKVDMFPLLWVTVVEKMILISYIPLKEKNHSNFPIAIIVRFQSTCGLWITKGFKWRTYISVSAVEWFIWTSKNICKLKHICAYTCKNRWICRMPVFPQASLPTYGHTTLKK